MNHETVVRLADQIDILPGQVVSKTLAQNGSVSVTLFGLIREKKLVRMNQVVMLWLAFCMEKGDLLLMEKSLNYQNVNPSLCLQINHILYMQLNLSKCV